MLYWALLLVPESPAVEEDVRQSKAATGAGGGFDSPEAGAAETGDEGAGEATTPGARWGQGGLLEMEQLLVLSYLWNILMHFGVS